MNAVDRTGQVWEVEGKRIHLIVGPPQTTLSYEVQHPTVILNQDARPSFVFERPSKTLEESDTAERLT